MRNTGVRFECLRIRPHDHIGWVFSGTDEFAELARPFLAEGAARGERLMYVPVDAADPGPALAGNLCVEGEIDSSAVSQVRLALSALPAKTGILVDLTKATLLSATALGGLSRLATAGFDVIVRGPAAAIERLTTSGVMATERFIVQTA